eukprot:TRINITY_DN2137_c0_g1_i2.p1 TRINITY_DN2137_c0_g1~~TRINITY_DN2137_c0_g1_i2.p1  ORF type:complete len:958 (+),score=187.58 TRINITY_DN2137_c0_g1_i2:22-2895(+)
MSTGEYKLKKPSSSGGSISNRRKKSLVKSMNTQQFTTPTKQSKKSIRKSDDWITETASSDFSVSETSRHRSGSMTESSRKRSSDSGSGFSLMKFSRSRKRKSEISGDGSGSVRGTKGTSLADRRLSVKRKRGSVDSEGAVYFQRREEKRSSSLTGSGKSALDVERMGDGEFLRWLEMHHLNRFKPCFKDDHGMFVKSDRKNVLELSFAKVDQLVDILYLPETGLFFQFFDRDGFIMEFLCGYQLFMTPRELFDRIALRYQSISFSVIGLDIDLKNCLVSFLRRFLYIDGYQFDSELKMDVEELLSFIRNDFPSLSIDTHFESENLSIPEESIIPEVEADNLSLLYINAKELAKQLTMMEQELYLKVSRAEILIGEYNEEDSPNLYRLITHQRRTDLWVRTEILRRGSVEKRSQIIGYFLRVADELKKIRNYSTLSHIILALDSLEIQKLRDSWELELVYQFDFFKRFIFGERYIEYLSEIETLSNDENFIPLVSYACEMTSKLNEVIDTFTKGRVNWRKMKSFASILRKSRMLYYRPAYSFMKIKKIENFIKNSEVWENEDIRWSVASTLTRTTPSYDVIDVNDLWEKDRVFDAQDWEFLYLNATQLTYRPGEVIIAEGNPMRRLYQIQSGKVTVMKDNTVVRSLNESRFIGIGSYIEPQHPKPSEYKYVAFSSVKLHKFKPYDVMKLCNQHPRIGRMLNHWIALQCVDEFNSGSIPTFSRRQSQQVSRFQKEFESYCDLNLEDEVVLYETPCKLKHKKIQTNGYIMCTQNYFSYVSKEFGRKQHIIQEYEDIHLLDFMNDKLKFLIKFKDEEMGNMIIKAKARTEETFNAIKGFWKQKRNKRKVSKDAGEHIPKRVLSRKTTIAEIVVEDCDIMSLNKEEWNLVLEGTEQRKYKAGEMILDEGNDARRLYHIASGKCTLIKDGIEVALYEDQIFGKKVLDCCFSYEIVVLERRTCW